MRQPIEVAADSGNTVTVLSVTPCEEDQFWLQNIIGDSKWKLYKADRLESALAILRDHEVGVVLSENDVPPHSWTDILHVMNQLRDAPALIVTSRLADDRLWAEALNLGAYDVLAKPFNPDEVRRSVSLALDELAPQARKRHQITEGHESDLKQGSSVFKHSMRKIKIANRSGASVDPEAVEAMAYQLWLLRGSPIGSGQQDWYRAEAELKGQDHANQHAA